jgi:predicted 2-oxoglutarate/Fe(II)-dependent dioxygenase YbiX
MGRRSQPYVNIFKSNIMKNDVIQITNLSNYWKWEKGLSSELCDLLLKDRAALEEIPAAVGYEEVGKLDKNKRNSSVCWAPVNHWIEGILYNYGLYATQEAGWNFQLGRPEQIQLTAYDKDGFYGWHEDWGPFSVSPSVRKVSVVALLSDPSEFEGGKFQIDFGGCQDIEMKRGSVIAFPSFVTHQVTPVTSGKRYSAVCWINGPRTF